MLQGVVPACQQTSCSPSQKPSGNFSVCGPDRGEGETARHCLASRFQITLAGPSAGFSRNTHTGERCTETRELEEERE